MEKMTTKIPQRRGGKGCGREQGYLECVDGRVMCWSVFDLHEVENIATAADEKKFHDRVVYGYEVGKKGRDIL